MDLYNKYRQREFTDMYPTSKLIEKLPDMIKEVVENDQDIIPHGMLFYSTRPGIGKTTVGRVLADKLNPSLTDEEREAIHRGKPNPVCFEMNAAKYRGIADASNLDDEISYRSDALYDYRYVYIIDEAHKLTADAQDVFLKTVENIQDSPIYLIFTTTEYSKTNDFLLSRLQKYEFRPLYKDEITSMIRDIGKKEGCTDIPDTTIDEIFEKIGGSARDALSELGVFIQTGSISGKEIDENEGPVFKDLVDLYAEAAMGGFGSVSWSNKIVPLVHLMLKSHSAEEVRIKLMRRISAVITKGIIAKGNAANVYRVGQAYRILAETFIDPVGFPQWSNMVSRFYIAFMQIAELGNPKE